MFAMDTSPGAGSVDDMSTPNSSHKQQDESVPRKMRACHNCARLKMKCRWPDGHDNPEACIRCARMRISCVVPTPMQRKKRGKSTRVAQLEQKIDGIVSLLTASQQLPHSTPGASAGATVPGPGSATTGTSPPSMTPETQAPPPEVVTLPPKDKSPPRSALSSILVGHTPAPPPEKLLHHHRSDGSIMNVVPGFDMTFARADELLEVYRSKFSPTYQFVQIPPTTSSYMLHSSKPFLFWTLMHVVASQTPAIQLAMKEWLHKTIAERIVVKGERSLELLQAIIVYCGWSDLHFYIEHQATTLIHLANSLVSDLNLNRVPGSVGAAPNTLLGDAWLASHRFSTTSRQHHSYDEMRATMGVFFLSSMYSSIFKRNHNFHFTTYLNQCVDLMSRKPETDLDPYLIATIRVQNMAERIYSVFPNPEVDDCASFTFHSPMDIAVNSVRREMDFVYNSFADVVKTSFFILPHYFIVSARLYEPVASMPAPTISNTSMASNEPFRRTEMLWQCLQRIKDFCSAWFTIPVETFAICPFATSSYMTFCLILAAKLLIGESFPDWDSSIARAQMDFPDLIQRVSDRFEEADLVVQRLGLRRRFLADGSPAVLKYTFKFRWLKQWYHMRTQQTSRNGMDMAAMAEALHMEFGFDEDFWRAVMMSDGLQGPADPRMQVDRHI